MITVRLASLADLNSINQMLIKSIMPTITPEFFNDADILIVAEVDGIIAGCLYVGVMAQGQLGYIDKFYIEPHYAKKQIGKSISQFAIRESQRRGITNVFGIIQHSMHHDQSAMNALKAAMGSDGKLYTYVNGNVPFMASELGF